MSIGRTMVRLASAGLATVLACALLIVATSGATLAQEGAVDCRADEEPNDTPDEASVATGAFCLTGTLPGGDQDILLLDLGSDAGPAWTVELTGVMKALTGLKLIDVTSESGVMPVETGATLLTIESDPAFIETLARDVLLSPGRYLFGISRAESSQGTIPPEATYTVALRPDPTPPPVLEAEPNDDQASATPVGAAFALTGDLVEGSDVYRWTVPETAGDGRWELYLQTALGTSAALTLADKDGVTLAYAATYAGDRLTLVDLDLAPGTYGIRVDPYVDVPTPYILRADSMAPVLDAEPNDLPGTEIALDPGDPVASGRLAPDGDVDRFGFEVPAQSATILREIRLLPAGPYRSLCLERPDGTTVQCREGSGGVVLDALALTAGPYVVIVRGSGLDPTPYVVRVDEAVEAVPGFEVEPNDQPVTATPVDVTAPIIARGRQGDTDTFRLEIVGEPQLWEVLATGDGISSLDWVKADGRELGSADALSRPGQARLTDVFLTPGVHWFEVQAEGEYQLEAVPLGPPDPDAEREPNNEAAFAEPYRLSRERLVGRLTSPSDRDVLRFTLSAPEYVRLRVDPPADGAVDLDLEAGGGVIRRSSPGPGMATEVEAFLQPADYEVWLMPSAPSEGHYTFTLERLDPLTLPDDLEPNDSLETASILPPTLHIAGHAEVGDDDWYRLPAVAEGSILSVEASDSVTEIWLASDLGYIGGSLDGERRVYTSEPVFGGDTLRLAIRASGDYTAAVSAAGLVATPAPGPLPLALDLAVAPAEVAAYWPTGQRVDGRLTLTNVTAADIAVELDGVTSHFAWTVEPEVANLTVPAGGSTEVPVRIRAQADAWADEPVRITLRARRHDGAQQTASAVVTPRRSAPPVAPERIWGVPEKLLGGFDVASLALGAAPLPMVDPVGEGQLHDGLSHVGMGFVTGEPIASTPVELTVDLAGEGLVPVAGMVLDPQAASALPGDAPRHVELQLSTDGVTFETVLEAAASPLMREQLFVLDEPVAAAWARLRLLSTWPGGDGRVALGEWKVIAEPGISPTMLAAGSDDLSGPSSAGFDVAELTRGGHVSMMLPQPGDSMLPGRMLTADLTPESIWVEGGASTSWVLGFRDGRAAQLTALGWQDPVPNDPANRLARVDVELSLDGPAGPWQPVGAWELERSADGSVPPFMFESPTWARYLRFSGKPRGRDGRYLELPGKLSAFERADDPAYRSILGEWGTAERAGPYEWLAAPSEAEQPAPLEADGPEAAVTLTPGVPARALIEDRSDSDWYALSIPEGNNSLEIDVRGEPLLVVSLTLLDAEGFEVPVLFGPGEDPGTLRYSAEVTPGASYLVRVQQPPSSIVFTFDTSGSMGPYLDYVYQGLRAFTADVQPGEEAVKIVPFEEEPLLDEWSDEPYVLQNAVDRYVPTGGSSSIETALIGASTELSTREGARAILVVSDAETSSYHRAADLWQILASSRPLIVAVHVGATSDPGLTRGWMEDWAGVAGGVYQYTRSHGEMDRAFDRLATWLRRPAGYRLDLATEYRDTPPPSAAPGSLSVRAKGAATATAISSDVGIEIILDTSGSMLEPLGRQRRIDVARGVLRELVGERLPRNAQVALRIFGDRDAPCATDLAAPLGPLDRVAMLRLIDGLDVVQETNTPIGAALARVADDLAGAPGTKIVLLITDGEETCGGDPARAIRDLRRKGIDARVNLVGFALQDARLKAQMRSWARSGQGSYFDARSSAALAKAVRQAISPPVRVLDAAGNEIARGAVNGEGLAVPPGIYSVVVLSDPVVRFDAVEVEARARVVLEIPQPAPQAAATDEEDGAADAEAEEGAPAVP